MEEEREGGMEEGSRVVEWKEGSRGKEQKDKYSVAPSSSRLDLYQ